MEKTKLHMDFPVETYGGLDDLQVTQPEIITGQFTIILTVHKTDCLNGKDSHVTSFT